MFKSNIMKWTQTLYFNKLGDVTFELGDISGEWWKEGFE